VWDVGANSEDSERFVLKICDALSLSRSVLDNSAHFLDSFKISRMVLSLIHLWTKIPPLKYFLSSRRSTQQNWQETCVRLRNTSELVIEVADDTFVGSLTQHALDIYTLEDLMNTESYKILLLQDFNHYAYYDICLHIAWVCCARVVADVCATVSLTTLSCYFRPNQSSKCAPCSRKNSTT